MKTSSATPERYAMPDPLRRTIQTALLGLVCAFEGLAAQAAESPRFSLPVACELGRTCFIQHHVDIDGSSRARDFACGTATYNGHDGVDFRLLSAAAAHAGVSAIAPAQGRVLRVRDGMTDAFARDHGRSGIASRECGNGLVIDHGDGIETQYCHLLRGSIVVRPGDRVERGDMLGKVGYSGLADFAHLHFTIRRDGRVLDPFSGQPGGKSAAPDPSCRHGSSESVLPGNLWESGTSRKLVYRPTEIIQTGFAAAIPDWKALERDHRSFQPAAPTAGGLVVFARAINLNDGDRLRFLVEGPNGLRVAYTAPPLGSRKAVYVAGAGKRLTAPRWASGRYLGKFEVLRNGHAVAQAAIDLMMP
ncbi:MAG: M23 family metallopeptidase [Hyphomicrobiaceae bacterium]